MFGKFYDKTDKPIGRFADWSSVAQLLISGLLACGVPTTLVVTGASNEVNSFFVVFGWFGVGLIAFLIWLAFGLAHALMQHRSNDSAGTRLAYLIGLASAFGFVVTLVMLARDQHTIANSAIPSNENIPVQKEPQKALATNPSLSYLGDPIVFSATSAVNSSRVRVFADLLSRVQLGDTTWSQSVRVPVGSFVDLYKGQYLAINMLHSVKDINQERRMALNSPMQNMVLQPGPNKLRIVLMDDDGNEQYFGFLIVLEDSREKDRWLTVLTEKEVGTISGF